MDISTLTLATPDMFETAGDLLGILVNTGSMTPKGLAMSLTCSADSIYSAIKNMRPIPIKERRKLSALSFIGALSVIMEGTDYKKMFGYQKEDRHILAVVGQMADNMEVITPHAKSLQKSLKLKNSRDDLAEVDIENITFIAKVLVNVVNDIINFLAEIETRYQINVIPYIQGREIIKEKNARVGARTA